MTIEEALKIVPENYSVHGDVATALRVLQGALRAAEGQVVAMREAAARVADRQAKVSRAYAAAPGQRDQQGWLDTAEAEEEIAEMIRALPAPAARTYEDGVRACLDAVRGVSVEGFLGSPEGVAALMQDRCERAVAERMPDSPAPAVAPVANDRCRMLVGPNRDRCTKPECHASECAWVGADASAWREDVAPVVAPKPGPATFAQSECMRCGSRAPGMHDCTPVAFDAEAALVAAREAARTGLDRNPTVEARQIAHLLHRMLSDALAAGRGAR